MIGYVLEKVNCFITFDKMRGMALKRARIPMTDYVKKALTERGLMDAYLDRPPYQQNDYLSWITRGVRQETKEKRINQMLEELEQASGYMGMPYKAKKV